jgi:hypothetical protein
MKFKIWFTTLFFFGALWNLNAQVLFTENFDYTAGDSIGAHGWVGFSGAVNNIKVKSPGLSYTNYVLSNIGNCARLSNNGLDNYKNAVGDSITSGTAYVSFMVKVDSAKTTGDYFLAMLSQTSTTNYYLRVFVKDTLGGVCFGVSKSSISASILPAWGTTVFPYGTTVLVVAKYKFNTGSTTDDEISLFAFSSILPSTEPLTPYAGPFTNTQTDATVLSRVALRQGSASIGPSLDIDGIMLCRSWSNMVSSAPISPTLLLPLNNSAANPVNLNLVWSKPTGATGYNVLLATDSAFTNIILNDSTLTDSVRAVTNLNPLTTYYWKVRAITSGSWGAFSGVFNFKTLGVPVQVTLSNPANNSTNQPVNLAFNWFKSVDQTNAPFVISNYWFEMATDAGFTNIVTRDSLLSDTTKSLTGLSYLTTYYWRVKAKNQIDWGTFSTAWTFTTVVSVPAVPSLLSPLNNSTGNPLNLNLVWSKPQYATGYNAVIATDSGFTSIVLNDSTLTDSIKTITSLNPLTNYYWKVRSKNSSGWGSFSSSYNFKTLGAPNQVVLSSPSNNSTGQPVNLTFNWLKAINQTNRPIPGFSYWFELATDVGFTNIVTRDSLLIDTTKSVTGLYNITDYFWRVKAKNTIGWGAFSTGWKFTTIVPVPSVPVLISPLNNSTGNSLSLNLVWNKPQYATGYNVVLATDSGFTSIVLNDSTLTDSIRTLTNLSPLTKYYWKVRAKDAAGWSTFSGPYNFKTFGVPTQVILSSPSNNATGQAINITFVWFKAANLTNEPVPGFSYWFELATDAGFTNIVTRDSLLTDTTKSVTGLNNITDYYWRVKAKNTIGWGTFSTGWKFTTIVPIPGAPTLLSPAFGSTGNPLNLNLIWTKPINSTNYNVILATDTGYTNIVLNDSTLTDSVKTLTSLNPLTTYYWKVRAKSISGWSGFSGTFNFKTIGSASQVTLSSPSNNATNQPVNLSFIWFKAADQTFNRKTGKNGNSKDGPLTVSNYWFELATDTGFTSIITRDSSLTDTTKSITGLNNITTYYWRVKAKNQINWGTFSSTWNFTTIVPTSGTPTQISPLNNSTGNPLNLNLVWTKPALATGYNLVLSTDAGFTTTLLNDSTLTDSLKALTNLNPLTTYYWKVRAKNAAGWGSFSSVYNFKTIGTATQVVLSTPANNSTGQPTSLTFKWFKAIDLTDNLNKKKNNKGEADGPLSVSNYWFELSTDSLFVTGVTRDSLLTDTTKSLTGLNNLTKYYWRVKGKNQINWGSFSSVWNLTTIISVPASPVLLTPVNNSTGISLTPALTWNTVSGASSYRIQVSTDSTFAATQWDTTGVAGITTTVPAGKLTGLTKYYWRVNATNAGGTSSFSNIWNFRTVQNLTLNLKVYLEGFWNGTSQVSDTVKVYLANSTTPFALVDSANVVLSTTGTSAVNFTKTPNGSYYVIVNHRNHLETWSATAQSFVTNAAVNFDFTTASTQAYGSNMKQVGSVWVLYGGDANRDGSIDASDISVFILQFGNLGYYGADFNGDGSVDATDIIIILQNFGLIKITPVVEPLSPELLKNRKAQIDNAVKMYNNSKDNRKKSN